MILGVNKKTNIETILILSNLDTILPCKHENYLTITA